ncbi:hypothetical protein, partial [Klebsiella michiganensis]|uniref:hypothetical protein n=1 Tax=Klebsiella michiganensis TaxID=1134687 RepID=UPI0031D37032
FHITLAKSGSMAAIDDLQIHHNIFSLANRRRPSMNKSDFGRALYVAGWVFRRYAALLNKSNFC